MRSRRPAYAVSIAAGAGAALVWLWLVTFHSAAGRWLDDAVLLGFLGLRWEPLSGWADRIAHLADPAWFALWLAGLVAIALLRGRRRTALLVAVTLPLANLTTQLLKQALAAPRVPDLVGHGEIAEAAWPSGHATASMSLALGLVLVVAPRWRPLAGALGGLFATAVPFAIMLLGWHYPSDVLAGYGIAVLFVCGALAISRATEPGRAAAPAGSPRRGARPRELLGELSPTLAAAVGCAVLAVVAAVTRFDGAFAYAQAHTTFALGAPLLAAVGLAIAAALPLLVRAPDR